MDEIIEAFYSGFCRVNNDTRRICAEYSTDQGHFVMEDVDCNFYSCKYSASCLLIREALDKEKESV